MLAKMYLTNFLSFKERTEIDLTASKYSILGKTNVYKSEILKGALFIGPNASGKSNALKGLSFIIKMIKGEASDEEIDELEEASALKDISHMPARVKCAVLGWHTLEEMLNDEV